MPPTGGIHPAPQQGPKRQENAYRWAPEHPMLWATSWLTAQIIQRQLLSSQAAQISAPNFLSRTSVLVGHHYKPSPPHTMLTGIKTAEDPGMVGLGRVPGMEAGMGCLCLLWRWSRDDREPGTGLGTKRKKIILFLMAWVCCYPASKTNGDINIMGKQIGSSHVRAT